MADVIREDVISIGFDFDDSVFSEMLKQVNEFKQGLSSGFDTSEIDNIKKNIEPSREAIKDLEEGVLNAKKELSGGVDTSGIDDIKKNTEQVKEVVNNLESGIENVKEELSGSIDTSEIDSVKKSADMAKEAMKGLENSVKNAKSELSADIDTSGIDDVKKSAEQAKKSIKKFSGITESIERFDKRMAALKGNVKAVGNAFSHPISTIKNGLSSIKNEITETASKIKILAQTKMSNLTSNIKEVYSTLSRSQTGAKGFVTALKSIGKVSFEKTVSGIKSITYYNKIRR